LPDWQPADGRLDRPPSGASRRSSALLAQRSSGWHFEIVDVPLTDLKAGGSLNGLLAW